MLAQVLSYEIRQKDNLVCAHCNLAMFNFSATIMEIPSKVDRGIRRRKHSSLLTPPERQAVSGVEFAPF